MSKHGYSGGVWPSVLLLTGGCVLIILVLGLLSCRTVPPTKPEEAVSLSLDAVPGLLKADSASVSSIWATVLDSGRPVRDSTLVYFASSLGTITADAVTKDGLARAVFTPGADPGVAVIIAQVKAVRDTVWVTVY